MLRKNTSKNNSKSKNIDLMKKLRKDKLSVEEREQLENHNIKFTNKMMERFYDGKVSVAQLDRAYRRMDEASKKYFLEKIEKIKKQNRDRFNNLGKK